MADKNTTPKAGPVTVTQSTFDPASLLGSVKTVKLAPQTRDRGTGPNPFEDLVAASYEDFTAKREAGRELPPVPADQAQRVVYLLRAAANSFTDDKGVQNVGLRVVAMANGKELKTPADYKANKAAVTIQFAAKNRKERKDS
jgi:hypothetical protein